MTLALIDGDVLAYQACYFVWEERLRECKMITDQVKTMLLDDEGDFVVPEMTKEQERRYLEKAWKSFNIMLTDLLDVVYCEEYLMAVKGEDNFRNLLYPEYKLNRHLDPSKRNIFVPTLRKLAVAEGLAIESTGREADDLLRIWGVQAEEAGDEYIVCTIDKDMRCMKGRHYNLKHKTFFDVDEMMSKRHYYGQLLKGDPTDNIPGVPRIGDVKAAKLVADCKNDNEFQEVVVNAYINAYGDDWYNYFLSNAKMIHLQRHENDYFNASEWPVLMELR